MLSRRTCVVALLLGALVAPSTAYADCPGADLVPTTGNLADVREALLCLHNEERAERSLPALKEHARLRRAAAAHSEDMVERGYFSHTARGGATFVDRILDAGYVGRFDGWQLGENLAWGTGRARDAARRDGRLDGFAGPPAHDPPPLLPRRRLRDPARRPA